MLCIIYILFKFLSEAKGVSLPKYPECLPANTVFKLVGSGGYLLEKTWPERAFDLVIFN